MFVSRKSYGSDPSEGKQRALQDDNAESQCRLVATGKKSLTPEGASYRFSMDDLMRKRVPS
jgi:hypothetical protein